MPVEIACGWIGADNENEQGGMSGAGGRETSGSEGFGRRDLVVFEGAGFDLSFSVLLTCPVTVSAQNRSSTTEYC